MRTVGVLGGMGPEATVLLMQKVIGLVPAQDDADHVPLIVDQNTQVPSRIGFLINEMGDSPAPVLAGMARRLQQAGAEALAMPCNTAHHFAKAIRTAVNVPLLDMVQLAADYAVRLGGGGRVGILASPAVRRVGLFEAPFAQRGLTAIWPERDDDSLTLIRRIKGGDTSADLKAGFAALSAQLRDRGASVQMIACTEFSLIPDAVADGVTSFDTLDQLAAAVVEFSKGPARSS